MTLQIALDAVPLVVDAHGVARMRGSRVTLDSVITAFKLGASAEGIVDQFPTLDVADVYAVLGYYLHHQPEVEVYLEEQDVQARKVRSEMEARFNPAGIRERLLARRRQQTGRSDDPSGGR